MADKKIYPREEMFLQDDTGRPTMNGLAQHRVLSGEVEKEQEVLSKLFYLDCTKCHIINIIIS